MNAGTPIQVRSDEGFADWLRSAGGCVAISTYQAGKVALVGWDGRQVTLLMRQFDKPMGMAFQGDRAAIACRHEVVLLANSPLLACDYMPDQAGRYDTLFLPRAAFYTGDLNVHDIAYGSDGLCLVATRFSCLAQLSESVSFLPRWQPRFISQLAPEDRCHLNGLAMRDGRPAWVTALGESDDVGGWRAAKAHGGIVIDVAANQIVARGLSMPHSPRWHDGRLFVLNSGTGELCQLEPEHGRRSVICRLPGYLRGLCFAGEHALIGMCQIRERHIFGGLPIQESGRQLRCGVAVVHLANGQLTGQFEFTSGCQEVYDVHFLPNALRPNILAPGSASAREAFTSPNFAYWLRPANQQH